MNIINWQRWPRGNQEVYKAWTPPSKKIKWEEVINCKTDTQWIVTDDVKHKLRFLMHLVGASNDKSVISAIYLDILSSRKLVPVVFLFSNMPLPYGTLATILEVMRLVGSVFCRIAQGLFRRRYLFFSGIFRGYTENWV